MSRKHKILISLTLLGLGMLTLKILFSGNGVVDFVRMQKEYARLVEKNETVRKENVALYREIDRLNNDLKYLEEVARKELGFIGPQEIIVRLKNEMEHGK